MMRPKWPGARATPTCSRSARTAAFASTCRASTCWWPRSRRPRFRILALDGKAEAGAQELEGRVDRARIDGVELAAPVLVDRRKQSLFGARHGDELGLEFLLRETLARV